MPQRSAVLAPYHCTSARWAARGLALMTLLQVGLVARPVLAQSAGANEWSRDSTIAQHLGAGPKPGEWHAEGTAGAQFLSGRTDTRGYDVDLIVAHSTRSGMLWRLDAEWRRADARLREGQALTVLDDTRLLALSAVPRVGEKHGVLISGILRQDDRADLDLRSMVQVGPYWQAIGSPALHLSLVPFVAVGHQTNARTDEGAAIEAFGGIASLTWRVTKTARLELYWSGHRVFGDAEDHAWQGNASLSAALSKHLALKVAYNVAHEGIVPLEGAPRQHGLTTGLSLAFPRLGGPSELGDGKEP